MSRINYLIFGEEMKESERKKFDENRELILKELEEENRRLKQMYADLSLKAQMQEDIIKKL